MLEALYELLIYPWTLPFFQKAVVGGCLVAIPCAVLGCLVVLRRMAFLGDALSHAMLAGVCGGYLVMKMAFGAEAHAGGMIIGAVLAAVITIALISWVSNVTRIKEDTSIGIMYTGIFSAGVVLVSLLQNYVHIDIYHFIIGDILGIGDSDLWISAFVGSAVLTGVILFYRHLQLSAFDKVMAAAIGLPVVLIEYLLTTGVSLVVVTGVRIVGMIMVVGLLITPAASAYLLCNRLWTMMITAALFGMSCIIGGMYLAQWIHSSGGGAIILFATLQFLVVLVVAPRHGVLAKWWRQYSRIPQEMVEDVLGAVLRAPDEQVAEDLIIQRTKIDRNRLRRICSKLHDEGLLERYGNHWLLTAAGRTEAIKLRRAHRLWETYLNRLGVPAEDLHERAHLLEHVNDEKALEYIDDLLGHPEQDPHGSEIPQPEIDPDQPYPVSKLRSGTSGEVALIGPSARSIDLAMGERVTIGPRSADGHKWTVLGEDGRELQLDHEVADAVVLRLNA